jgi:serine protease Do
MRRLIPLLLFVFALPAFAQLPMQCGTLVAGQFHILSPIASDGSFYNWWDFQGTAGQTVTIDMHSILFDTNLVLIDPAGRPVAQNDDAATDRTDSHIAFTLTQTGTWQIVANSILGGQVGDYKLTLQCGEAPAPPPPSRRRGVKR